MREARMVTILSAVLLASCVLKRGPGRPPPEVAPSVDLVRYSGAWYEIAGFPNRFQKGCSSTSAT